MLLRYGERLFEFFSQRVFGHGLTPDLKEFAGHISWSATGGLISAGILLSTNILAGRLLGAEEYGKYNVIFACAQILIVILLFGMDLSVARSLAMRPAKERQAKDISAALSLVILPIILVLIGFIFLHEKASALFHLNTTFLFAAVFLGIVLALRQFLDSVMRGIGWFKTQSFVRIMEACGILGLFFAARYIFEEKTFLAYMVPLILGGILLCLAYIWILRSYFTRFDRTVIQGLTGYGKIAFLATLFGIAFGSLDKLAIARYLSFRDVGIYGAYYTASFIIVSQIGALFDNVFFPTVARFKDNLAPIIRKVDLLSLYFSIPFLLGMCGVIYVLLRLFGNGYPITWAYILGFGVIATLKMILILNTSLITAYSKKSLTLGLIYGNSVNIIFILIFFIFIRLSHLSIFSMIWFLILYTGSFICVNKLILYKVGFYRKSYVAP